MTTLHQFRDKAALPLERFCEYMEMNPDEIIAAYKGALDKSVHEGVDEWNERLDLFVPWIMDKSYWAGSSVKRILRHKIIL